MPHVREIRVPENNGIPNHPRLPALLCIAALRTDGDLAERFEQAFRKNGWTGLWRWGMHPFHHFHSTAHEVLGVSVGSARIQIGGPDGPEVEVSPGDLILLPAGTGHRCVSHSSDFLVVGAYPPGQTADLLRANEDLEAARQRIAAVTLPSADPLFGHDGLLTARWEPNPHDETGPDRAACGEDTSLQEDI